MQTAGITGIDWTSGECLDHIFHALAGQNVIFILRGGVAACLDMSELVKSGAFSLKDQQEAWWI